MKVKTKHNARLALALAAALLSSSNTNAATLTVTSTADSGTGSLRAALAAATNGDTIDATGVSGAILLTTGELLVSNSVSILGPGPGALAVNGNAASRAFHITNGVTALIAGLTVTNGSATGNFPTNFGGGIYNDHSTLTVSNCAVSSNLASGGGGGLYNDHSTLTVANSTVSGNSAPGVFGGGLYNNGSGGSATLTLISSTVSSNSAFDGGGIFNNGESSGTGMVSVTNSTLSANSAANGGGIFNDGTASGTATLAVSASTISGSTGGGIWNNGAGATLGIGDSILNTGGASGANLLNIIGAVNSHGYNLCSDTGAGFFTNATDQVNTDPMLGPLADNGGPTPTMALGAGSPAIDKGKSFGLTSDQRGAPRPFDFSSIANATGGDGSDIGAFELGTPRLNIQNAGGNTVMLSWPAYYGGFSLESVAPLAASNNWSVVPGAPVIIGGQYTITSAATSNKFFRLSSD